MAQSGLFAHLALQFGADPEAVAAEALLYILRRSTAARAGLLSVCTIACPGIPHLLDIRRSPDATSAPGPSLEGIESDGTRRLALLPKFWNALSDRQPWDDLQRLSADRTSALVVVAPARRFTALWAELRRRCRLAGLPVHGDHAAGDPVRWTKAGPRWTMVLVSWSSALAGVRSSVAAANDEVLAREIDQLASLCDQMDADAFAPLTASELAAATPRRLAQLLDLVDDLAAACEQRGIGRISEPDATTSPGIYSRRVLVGPATLVLTWSVPLWATLRETPFWLRIAPANDHEAQLIDERLHPLCYEVPPRLLRDTAIGQPLVPLFPLIGAEREAVLADLARQVEEVARLIDEAPTVGFGASS